MREKNSSVSTATKWIITLLTCLFIGLVIAKVSINKDWEREQQNTVKEEAYNIPITESREEAVETEENTDIQSMRNYLSASGVYKDEEELFDLIVKLLKGVKDDSQPWIEQVNTKDLSLALTLANEIGVKHNSVEAVSGTANALKFQEISKEIATEFIIVEKYLEKGFLSKDIDSIELVSHHLNVIYEKKNELVSIIEETEK